MVQMPLLFPITMLVFLLLQVDEADAMALVGLTACESCLLNREAVEAFEAARYSKGTPSVGACTFSHTFSSTDLNAVIVADVNGTGDDKVSLELEIVTPPGQDLSRLGHRPATGISEHSDSTECFDKVHGWIADFSANHAACRKLLKCTQGSAEGPKRLIDTGPLDEDARLKLVDWPGRRGKAVNYGALSYSWGQDPRLHFTTTAETYEQRMNGFRIDQLPQTLQDAVVITRKVGCRYLWIDAVCIIQRNKADWEAESPRMHLIYGNAYLVIAATENSWPGDGIFGARQPAAQFEFQGTNKSYSLNVVERDDHSPWRHYYRAVDTHPTPRQPVLHTRAWAYQERLLATRIIHYTATGLVWECNTHCYCECGELQRYVPSNQYRKGLSLKSQFTRDLGTNEAWKAVLEHYSVKQLTVRSDKLPALAGLAKRFTSPTLGKYLAGIWYSQLPDALTWEIQEPQKPDEYRAPSWSWASLDGEVGGMGRAHRTLGSDCVEVLEAECTSAGKDSFGAVSDGHIVLKGQFGPLDYGDETWALKVKSYGWSLVLKRSERVDGAWERVAGEHVADGVFEGRRESVVKIV